MKKIFSCATLFVAFLICLSSCGHKLTTDEAIDAVVSGEKDRIPLLLQTMSEVDSITIDSMRILVADEPMSGYLYTTWTYTIKDIKYPTYNDMMRGKYSNEEIEEKRVKQIIVSVDNIRQSEEHKGYIGWETDWLSAYKVIIFDKLDN